MTDGRDLPGYPDETKCVSEDVERERESPGKEQKDGGIKTRFALNLQDKRTDF